MKSWHLKNGSFFFLDLKHPSLQTKLKTHTAYVYFEAQGTCTFLNYFFFIKMSPKKILNGADNLCIFVVLCILKPEFNIAWIQLSKNSLTTNT